MWMRYEPFAAKPPLPREGALRALDAAYAQVLRNLPQFTHRCQNHSSVDGFYPACDNDQWTCGFWPGEIWLAYERTGDETLKYAGLILAESFLSRIENGVAVDHHDMGFLYTPSCVAAYRITGNERAKEAALMAADRLAARYQPVGRFLQAWGALGAADNYRYIIDCLLNLPLLYWAGEQTFDARYRSIADAHLQTCLRHSFRGDGSTFHTVFMDSETGEMARGETCQGYRDDSSWARGQAWAIYGTALAYRFSRDPEHLAVFETALAYYLSRLPEDMVPYWDLIFTDGDGEPRDSSSASIVACGLLEMARIGPPDGADALRRLASRMMRSVVSGYSVTDPRLSNGQVLHATYSKKSPYNTCTPEGVDECVAWGDYFYMEALTRLTADWTPYW